MPWHYDPAPTPLVATDFDPAPLAALAAVQWAQWPALAEALLGCTRQWERDHCYAYLLDPDAHDWRYKANVVVHCPVHGRIAIDVLEDGSIGGLDYLDREPPLPTWCVRSEEDGAPFTVVHRAEQR